MSFSELPVDQYARLSARALGRMVAERRVSPVQLSELALALARAAEPNLNAYVQFLEEYALTTAREREKEARDGRLRSVLHGVPISVKDNFYMRGFALGRGSRTSPDYVPTENAPMVQSVLDAGAVIIGKTTMPEMGWKGTGISPLTGVTRNPWNTMRNCRWVQLRVRGDGRRRDRFRSRSVPTPADRSASRPHSAGSPATSRRSAGFRYGREQ